MSNIIYEEKIFSKVPTIILTIFTLIFLILWIYQTFIGQIGTNPAPTVIFLAMFFLFAFITFTFSRLTIKITSEFISVSFGIFKHKILWDEIEDIYLDKASVVRYGGWGIRFGRFKGNWRLVYNIIDSPRVSLLLKEGRFREFVFSTRNPQKIIELVRICKNNSS